VEIVNAANETYRCIDRQNLLLSFPLFGRIDS
jgi:hypothetical protein